MADGLCKDCDRIDVEVRRENVRRDGYTKGGTYYGFIAGSDVFSYVAHLPHQDDRTGEWETKEKYGSVRAADMASAKKAIAKVYPSAKFVR